MGGSRKSFQDMYAPSGRNSNACSSRSDTRRRVESLLRYQVKRGRNYEHKRRACHDSVSMRVEHAGHHARRTTSERQVQNRPLGISLHECRTRFELPRPRHDRHTSHSEQDKCRRHRHSHSSNTSASSVQPWKEDGRRRESHFASRERRERKRIHSEDDEGGHPTRQHCAENSRADGCSRRHDSRGNSAPVLVHGGQNMKSKADKFRQTGKDGPAPNDNSTSTSKSRSRSRTRSGSRKPFCHRRHRRRRRTDTFHPGDATWWPAIPQWTGNGWIAPTWGFPGLPNYQTGVQTWPEATAPPTQSCVPEESVAHAPDVGSLWAC